jgi:hypothetical protein
VSKTGFNNQGGQILRSFAVQKEDARNKVVIGTAIEYAINQELGLGVPEQSFLRLAVEMNLDRIQRWVNGL